jgi:hypothetical protein
MNSHKCTLVVRGISDELVDKDASQDESKQPVATALASAVAFELNFFQHIYNQIYNFLHLLSTAFVVNGSATENTGHCVLVEELTCGTTTETENLYLFK